MVATSTDVCHVQLVITLTALARLPSLALEEYVPIIDAVSAARTMLHAGGFSFPAKVVPIHTARTAFPVRGSAFLVVANALKSWVMTPQNILLTYIALRPAKCMQETNLTGVLKKTEMRRLFVPKTLIHLMHLGNVSIRRRTYVQVPISSDFTDCHP
mmetsp:Transcript_2239/g.3495  ORF Transcript_2239/g.3495 Transcript_2239/m.3495 type:complete len:157 (-) Transcript_2239:259-729(-)